MFEQHIDRVFIDLMDKIAFGGGFAYITDIVGMAPISRPWRAYLLAEVDWWVYEQQMARVGNPNFDFAYEEFIYAFQHLDSLYAAKARFTNDNLTKILKTAVKTRLNMLLRPRTTLKWFVFRGEPTKPYREIILRLNYLNDYKYISDGFVAHVERNQFLRSSNDIMSVNEFEKIIDEVDNEKIFNVTPQEFLEIVEPMFGFFNSEMSPEETDTIPTAALAIFFDDKGIFVLSKKLKQAIRNGETEITRRFLADFIYSSIEDSDRPDYTPETALPIAPSSGFSLADELARFNQTHNPTDELPNFGLGAMPESFFPKPLQDSENELEAEDFDADDPVSEIDELEKELDDISADIEDSILSPSECEIADAESIGDDAELLSADALDLGILEAEDARGAEEYMNGELAEIEVADEAIDAESEPETEAAAEEFSTQEGEVEELDLQFVAGATSEDVVPEEAVADEPNLDGAAEGFDTDILDSHEQPDVDSFDSAVDFAMAAGADESEPQSQFDNEPQSQFDNEPQSQSAGEEDDLSDLLAQFGGVGLSAESDSADTGEATATAPSQDEKLSMIMDTLSGAIDVDEMRREEERRKLEDSLREATEDKILEMNNASTSLDFLNLPQSSTEDESGFIVFDDDISEDLLNIAFKNKDTE